MANRESIQVAVLGAALGVPTPANRVLYALVRLLESKQR
jgi:ketopantoate reductase